MEITQQQLLVFLLSSGIRWPTLLRYCLLFPVLFWLDLFPLFLSSTFTPLFLPTNPNFDNLQVLLTPSVFERLICFLDQLTGFTHIVWSTMTDPSSHDNASSCGWSEPRTAPASPPHYTRKLHPVGLLTNPQLLLVCGARCRSNAKQAPQSLSEKHQRRNSIPQHLDCDSSPAHTFHPLQLNIWKRQLRYT